MCRRGILPCRQSMAWRRLTKTMSWATGMLPPDFVLKENVEKNDLDFVAPDSTQAAKVIGPGGDRFIAYNANVIPRKP